MSTTQPVPPVPPGQIGQIGSQLVPVPVHPALPVPGDVTGDVAGNVQAHGVLLALDGDLRVVMCSANTERMLAVAVDDVVGRPLAAILGTDVSARIAARRDDGFPTDPMVIVLGKPGVGDLGGQQVEVRVHASGQRIVVELESAVDAALPAGDYRAIRTATTRLTAAATLGEVTDLLASEVRELTGFDRVMVLRYDDAWEGEVIAEARRDDLGSQVGRHYPAAEAPSDARRLHELEPVQLVADVGAAEVPLVPLLDPDTGAPLDLSRASLRSVAHTHVDYLGASGVTASLSISLMIDEQLWGLIACHHYSGAHRPGHEVRSSAEFFTQVASHLVAHRVRADARESAARTRGELSQLTARLAASEGPVLDALFADPGLLAVFGATGAANLFDGDLRTRGTVPDPESMQEIADLLNLPDTYTSSTDRLAVLDERFAENSAVADGVLRVGTMGDRWGLWFRTDGARWEPWHAEAAEELGRHVNSLLLLRSREQVAMAESMQRSVVLDRAPVFAGVELVARYRPATTYQLGGDWWDAFELDDRRLVIVVGDVAGHGVAAASAMTQVRTALRAYLYDGHGAAGGLDRLDRLMDGLLGIGVATALVGVLDRETGLLEISSAGHPDPILVRPDGSVREVFLERRPLLGVGTGTAPTSVGDLSDGGLLILFTDGLVERRGLDTDVQTARLIDLAGGALGRRPHEDVARWADGLLADLDTPDDDTTLLAIRCS
ncbi:hypothetical protein BH09ACT12_BH09ACT12_08860 [soil metagenome]